MTRLSRITVTGALLVSATILLAPALAQRSDPPAAKAQGSAFDPSTLPDQEIGRRFTVNASDLPPPRTGPVVASRPLTIPFAGQTLRVPDGFRPAARRADATRRSLV